MEFPMDLFCVVVPGLRTWTESAGGLTGPFSCGESLMRSALKPFALLGTFTEIVFPN